MNLDNRTADSRKSNLELFRVITMLLIVAHHYVVNSGLTYASGPIASAPSSARSVYLLLLGAWGKTGINCFVLITGYFMCQKNITLKKFLKLLLEVVFYRVFFVLLFSVTGYEKVSFRAFIKALIPVVDISTNFTGCFLIFYLFIPFINLLIHQTTQKQHIRLLFLTGFTYIFFGTFKPTFSITFNYISWYIVLYLMASYIRLYPRKLFDNTRFWGVSTVICLLVSSLSVIICAVSGANSNQRIYYRYVQDANTFLAVATGLSAFMFFRNVRVPQNRFINMTAASTFGVLCIHANSDTMRKWLWTDMLKNVRHYYMPLGWLHPILSVILVFSVCICIDAVRIRWIEKPFFRALDKILPTLTASFLRKEERLFSGGREK